MAYKKSIFFTSLALTVLIFSTAIILNYSLDFFRLGSILGAIKEHEINYESYLAEEEFASAFGGDTCRILYNRIETLKEEIIKVGNEISNYGQISVFKKKEYEQLRRQYFLLQLKFLPLIEKANADCSSNYIPILFFYKSEDEKSERQGYILSEISKKFPKNVLVISLDAEYEPEPIILILLEKYNITETPSLIIGGRIRHNQLAYQDEIEPEIAKLIQDSDFYGADYDFGFVLDRTGTARPEFISEMQSLLGLVQSDFAKGDISLVLGRLAKNNSMICSSVPFYEQAFSENPEENAFLYETIASLGCKKNRKQLLLEASKIWDSLGVSWRAEIDYGLAMGMQPRLEFETSDFESSPARIENASIITLGASEARILPGDIIAAQSDRVSRDWLSYQLNSSPFSGQILAVFSERLSYSPEELLPEIGWHEGGRLKEMESGGAVHFAASATMIAEKEGRWYAPDENGVFSFEVPIDKVLYPTTRFLSKNIAVSADTHGISMIVEQAIRKNASFAVGCGDHPGKAKAAKYLSDKGITVISFPDKYLSLALGEGSLIFGSPPIRKEGSAIIVGGRQISFYANETIIAEDVEDYSQIQSYYDTPARYFRKLETIADLNVIYFSLSRMNSTEKLTGIAEFFNANVIAARIFNSDDYAKIKSWLEGSSKRRVILFHSMPYPYGYKLINEFPLQAGFGDLNPQII